LNEPPTKIGVGQASRLLLAKCEDDISPQEMRSLNRAFDGAIAFLGCKTFLGLQPLPIQAANQARPKESPMLVLSRHRDESIMIGDDVIVTIVDIRGDKVRLGINAPQDVPVHRQEVYEAIQRENRRASQVQPSETRSLAKPKAKDESQG
jgi:carbon storage regulator